ncbi:MAG: hypothetical protein JSV05_06435 [Candidatus Bathyarchaeota archaeon]|nr:MAG: hypothetical protein JSV05_06435 [Candidatus Bathyarchaeota archaeon]
MLKNDKGIVEVGKGALAIQINLEGRPRGYVFRGKGKLIVDSIVETKQGAVGKPVEKEVNESFLMLGEWTEAERSLEEADEEDYVEAGFKGKQEFESDALNLLDRFFKGGSCESRRFDRNRGFVFAFPNEKSRFDILVAKGSKLVYKAKDTVFVSKGNKVVLKSAGDVFVSRPGKSVIVTKDGCETVHIRANDCMDYY